MLKFILSSHKIYQNISGITNDLPTQNDGVSMYDYDHTVKHIVSNNLSEYMTASVTGITNDLPTQNDGVSVCDHTVNTLNLMLATV